jgi:hypothetical protein
MALTNAYCTLNELKAALRITDSLDDTLLENAINAAARLIDAYADRAFYNQGTAVRYYAANDNFLCPVDDIAGTALTLKTATTQAGIYDVTWQASDYQLEPLNGIANGQTSPYTRIRAVGDYLFPTFQSQAFVEVTAVWGWIATPVQIQQANLLQASRIYKRYESPLGVAGFGDFGAVRVGRALDPDVAQLVDPFRRIENVA